MWKPVFYASCVLFILCGLYYNVQFFVSVRSFQVFVNFAKDQSDEDHVKDISVNKSDVVMDLSHLDAFLTDTKAQETVV